jgi:hypothetical protein
LRDNAGLLRDNAGLLFLYATAAAQDQTDRSLFPTSSQSISSEKNGCQVLMFFRFNRRALLLAGR